MGIRANAVSTCSYVFIDLYWEVFYFTAKYDHMKRAALFVAFSVICVIVKSQSDNVCTLLEKAYSEDEATRNEILSHLSEEDVLKESDSVKYLFYYCQVAWMIETEQNSDLNSEYIDKAITLREKSIGILSSQYLELLWCKAINIEEKDTEEAISICQKALVTGESLVRKEDEAAIYWYGSIVEELASLYEQKGYESQLVSLYNLSFDLLSDYYYDEDKAIALSPLILLETYYFNHNRLDEANETTERLIDFLYEKGDTGSAYYAQALYAKGNVLGKCKQVNEAVRCYSKGMDILNASSVTDDELKEYIYANWFFLLLLNENYQEADNVRIEFNEFCSITGRYDVMDRIYLFASQLLEQKGNEDLSKTYYNKISKIKEKKDD